MRGALAPLLLLAVAVPAGAAGPALDHQAVSCLVAGQYPRLTACVLAPDEVARARVFFRPEGSPAWYHVIMERDAAAACFSGVLPKPKRQLVGRHVEYYVEAADRGFDTSRTAQHAARVVRRSWECRDPLVAAIAAGGPSAVFPSLPPGFAAGGIGTTTLLSVVGAGAAAGGAIVVAGGGNTPPPPPPPPAPPGAPSPEPSPSVTPPSPSPSPGPTPGPPLAVVCEARPDSGPVPLTVQFSARASGGSATPAFRWDFGDGGAAEGPAVEHTYRTSGRYDVVVQVTSGGQSERCNRTIAAAVTPVRRVTLTVSSAGTGSGTVASSPGGIDCGASCSAEFDAGTTLRLTATPAAGSTFRGWSGACNGTGACTLTLDASAGVTATFDRAAAQLHALTVQKAGNGGGHVGSNPAGIDCGTDCAHDYPAASTVVLTATAAAGSTLQGWSGGGCGGTGTCSVRMDAAVTVTATFNRAATQQHTLTVQKSGSGGGVVRSTNPAGIDCGTDCSQPYDAGTTVSLSATPNGNSTFGGWNGGGCSGTGGCQVLMSAPQTVTARFDPIAQRTFPLTVELAGRGTGTVRGSGIDCPGTCSLTFNEGTGVSINAQAGAESVFSRWELDCAPQSATCQLTMNSAKRARAVFDAIFRLNVGVIGPGHISGNPPQFICPGVCSVTRVDGGTINLSANAAAGASFQAWSGDCTGCGNPCALVMDRPKSCVATFRTSAPERESGPGVTWTSRLEAPRASGLVRAAGQLAAAGPGTAVFVLPLRPGENRVDAELVADADGPGTWRFEARAPGRLEGGSFRVLAGEAVQVEPEAIVFRLSGKAGERVAFSFRGRID